MSCEPLQVKYQPWRSMPIQKSRWAVENIIASSRLTLKISVGNEPELKQVIIAPVRCILVLGLKHLPKVCASTLQVQ
jgi:hypothetical protein